MFTAIFIGCLAITAGILIAGAAGWDGSIPITPPAHAVTPSAPSASKPPAVSNDKANLSPNGETIIGLRSPSLVVNSTLATFTQTIFDTTTYGDRAILKLTNNTGFNLAQLTGVSIRGKIVSQLDGKNGYVWEYSDYDSIEKEGEQSYEVSNDFIFSPTQAKSIGDFVWKELKPHKLYSLMLLGMHYNYEIGDVYHLTLTHVMNGGTMENIDTDVEVMGVSMSRNVGGVGTTNLNLRVPSSAWALTLARNARLVGAGNSQRLNNRSNVVTIASSTWTGQADYFCDGTNDNVEIQSALDYVSGLGGGEVKLTIGNFYISSRLLVGSNTILSGSGNNTILYGLVTTAMPDIFLDTVSNSIICDLVLDGSTVTKRFGALYTTGCTNIEVSRVEIRHYHSTAATASIWALVVDGIITNCYVHDISTSVTDYDAIGINGSTRVQYNIVDNINSTGGGTGYGYGYAFCRKCQQNKATNTSHDKYFASYADSAGSATYACADTSNGGFNS
jgi:hypothetical protein